ncbi:DNA cytosine methyltransferase [Vibrio parahaemolyticus]|uniref:DNA cytosine methyltransferase n=1 Tax=Vibrio parahaemolyticus TaxID=670 RepID=UPI003D818430
MRPMKMLELCTGIGGFHLAGKMNGNIETICTSEIDSYNVKFIDRNLKLDNAGDATHIAIPEAAHPCQELIEQDLVPVEETGFTSLCMEDFLEGVLDWPDLLTAGFPCQDVSPANLQGNEKGIDGEKSGLVHEILRIIENLEPSYCVFENSSNLPKRGLDYILSEFNRMGYICEWETIAACHFGLPHYRHRTYLVAYLPTTAIAKGNRRVFDLARKRANKLPNATIPLAEENPDLIKEWAVVEDTRSIKLRTKRLNSIGNSIVPQIALAIFDAITNAEKAAQANKQVKPRKDEKHMATSLTDGWGKAQLDMFSNDTEFVTEMPARGLMINGEIYTGEADRKLNPTKTTYPGLFSTIISRDGNNNFTTKSRLNRPGKLGGLVGDIMRIGADKGGLHPEFCEIFMGYPAGYTELAAA